MHLEGSTPICLQRVMMKRGKKAVMMTVAVRCTMPRWVSMQQLLQAGATVLQTTKAAAGTGYQSYRGRTCAPSM